MRLAALALSLVLTVGSPSLGHSETKLVVVDSKHSVAVTAERIVSLLKDKGIAVVARIDHAASARAAGLTLPDTEVIIFGNPKLGTPLMQMNPDIAIDLPMRILVSQSKDGRVIIGYAQPAELLSRYGLDEQKQAIATMTKVLTAVSETAAGQ